MITFLKMQLGSQKKRGENFFNRGLQKSVVYKPKRNQQWLKHYLCDFNVFENGVFS